MQVRARRAFALLRGNGIEPILIKGLAAARLYPEPGARPSGDVDMAVAGDDFERASKIVNSAAASGIGIDLHRELRHLDTVEWSDLYANSELIEIDGKMIRVLRPEDHLRVLCVHWLTDGGAYKEKLWDIYYLIAKRPPDFDWDRCLNIVSPIRRRWIVCTLGLAHRYLDLNLDDTPVNDEAENPPTWLVRAVEREWASETRLIPIHVVLKNPSALFAQIRKRLRPNPIQATVQMEGSFDAKTRLFYQLGNIFQRLLPSYKRVAETINQGPK